MEAAFKNNMPKGVVEGFLVQEMVCGSVETIIGAVNDPQYGPVVMFGIGGVFVELYKDVVFRMAPIGQEEALDMIRGIKGYPLLNGFRGKPTIDLESLAQAIVSVSNLALAGREWIQSIDVNPFIPLERGGKVVDAVIVTGKKEHRTSP